VRHSPALADKGYFPFFHARELRGKGGIQWKMEVDDPKGIWTNDLDPGLIGQFRDLLLQGLSSFIFNFSESCVSEQSAHTFSLHSRIVFAPIRLEGRSLTNPRVRVGAEKDTF
jgi:hypothetical protein